MLHPSSLPGIFEDTIFSPKRGSMPKSVFIKAMHPQAEISPTYASVDKILRLGWVGQMKIHGHRAQIHISANPSEKTVAYNRQGRPHKKLLPKEIEKELRRILNLKSGWTVIDSEWLKPENKLYIFDILKQDDRILRSLTYSERYNLLPGSFISPYIKVLPILDNVEKCMKVLNSKEDYIEGLVFKSLSTKGFEDTAIVRCRKR
jgi:ATP-dependent DNA ligase